MASPFAGARVPLRVSAPPSKRLSVVPETALGEDGERRGELWSRCQSTATVDGEEKGKSPSLLSARVLCSWI